MDRGQLQSQAAKMRKSLFDQGYLDDQFVQLEELQDDANPNFVEEVVKLFYTDSARLIRSMESEMEKSPLNFEKLDNIMHQFKGSSSGIGARKVKRECTQFQDYCNEHNAEGCIRTFQQVKQEHATLRTKLENYFQAKNLESQEPKAIGYEDHLKKCVRRYQWCKKLKVSDEVQDQLF